MQTVTDDADAMLAVVAHGLLNAVVPARGAASLLLQPGGNLKPEVQAELLEMISRRLDLVVDTLQDLVRGIPPEIRDVLEDMGPTAEAAEAATAPRRR